MYYISFGSPAVCKDTNILSLKIEETPKRKMHIKNIIDTTPQIAYSLVVINSD